MTPDIEEEIVVEVSSKGLKIPGPQKAIPWLIGIPIALLASSAILFAVATYMMGS